MRTLNNGWKIVFFFFFKKGGKSVDKWFRKADEVFSLELERSERGLGLALVDIRVSERAADHTKT